RSSFCGTFREPAANAKNFASPTSSPGVTWRVALYPSPNPSGPTTVVSGLSSRPVALRRPDQRSPGSPAVFDYIANCLAVGSRSRYGAYFVPTNFSNSLSVKTGTPSSFALSYFDPGSEPTTT